MKQARPSSQRAEPCRTDVLGEMLRLYGPLMTGEALRRALGFPSDAALRMAISRGIVPVEVFKLPKRRGRFARTHDVAIWLATAGQNPDAKEPQP